MEEKTYDIRSVRSRFSGIGSALAVILAVSYALQIVLVAVVSAFMEISGTTADLLSPSSWVYWVVSGVTMYAVAMPLGMRIMKKLPAGKPEDKKLKTGQFLAYIPLCVFLMYVGSITGTILASIFSGGTAQNSLDSLVEGNSILRVFIMVLLGPFMEELVFRKWLIDRTRRFGEKTAVVFSGITFAILHGNFYQMVYAFLLGAMFAYIYIRTGRLRYCVILHCGVNFFGSVITTWVSGVLDSEAMAKLTEMDPATDAEAAAAIIAENLGGIIATYAFVIFVAVMFVWGLVLFIKRCRKLQWAESEEQIPKGRIFKSAYLNTGMSVYFILCLVITVLSLF